MTMLSRNDQKGRSMVEMLGVLAIIGVLSVGGISGYSKAMAKFKLTKAQDQITMLLMNIRTAFATSPSYDGLNTSNSRAFNIAPGDMWDAASGLNNAFGGKAYVYACDETTEDGLGALTCKGVDSTIDGDNTVQYFAVTLTRLGREACVSLASSDWGTDGLIGMAVKDEGGDAGTPNAAGSLPINMIQAGEQCGDSGSYNTITWVYY
ncbi:MAG: hypothetical protein E7020_06480 [Alphaproteobacteria bacterium]|nr:hypothetical protein [Alphaproteobacteria bacterium]